MSRTLRDRFTILQGPAEFHVGKFPDEYFDACYCDPPYGYTAFKSRTKQTMAWEKEDAPGARLGKGHERVLWDDVFRVLKPGGVLMAASGARLYHRMASRIESAGFYIMDPYLWIYSGANATGVMEGQRLRPACEPYVVAWKPAEKVGVRLGKSDQERVPTMVGFDPVVMEALELQQPGRVRGMFFCGKATPFERGKDCDHPTLKPIALCKHQAGLLLKPKAKRVLVPFSGAGSEMTGCLLAGWPEVVGIEMEPKYVKVAEKRIVRLCNEWPEYWERKCA